MATWITHLRIADALLKDRGDIDARSFLIGSVAPDSGKLNSDNYTYTPPSTVSHFENRDRNRWRTEEKLFYERYVVPNQHNRSRVSFCRGYLYHLITDVLWGHFVYHPTKEQYSEEFADPQFIWNVKDDWYSIDFEFLDENRHWTAWAAFADSMYADDILDFYPRADISAKLEYIKEYYSARNGYLKKRTYLARADMEKFIDVASSILICVDKNIEEFYERSEYTIFEALEKEYEELGCTHKWIGEL